MDPNATLQAIRLIIKNLPDGDPILLDLAANIEGLDNWLSKGGFLPAAWARRDVKHSKVRP